MAERRRGLLARLGLRRDRTAATPWQEADAGVTVADAAAAERLAQEAATPFGYRRPAGELLAAFGGTGEEERRRATAALALAGVAADPPLTGAAPTQYVQLRRIDASAPVRSAPARPAAASPARPALPEPVRPRALPAAPSPSANPAPGGAPESARAAARRSPDERVAARFAPSAPVSRDRRIAAGALGLAALAVVMIVAVAVRGGIGGDEDSAASALPPATETTAAPVRTVPAPPPAAGSAGTPARRPRAAAAPPADSAGAPARRSGAATAPAASPSPSAPSRPQTVRLRVVPSEESYVCIADGAGETIWEGMLTGPYEVRRAKLVIRVGVATASITANGRAVRVTKAPGAFELTPAAIRELPGDEPVCGAAAGG